MSKKLYEFTMSDGSKKNMIAEDHGTHISIRDIGEFDDIDYIFGSVKLVTSKPSNIEKEIEYCVNNLYEYSSVKVKKYKLIAEK